MRKESKTQKLYAETKEIIRKKRLISAQAQYAIQAYLQKTYGTV